MLVQPSTLTLFFFLLTVAWVCVAFVGAVRTTAPSAKRSSQTALAVFGVLGWLILTAFPTATGWVTPDTAIPRLPILMVGWLLAVVALSLSPLGKRIAHGVPLVFLVGFQGFRFPLELILHAWVEAGVVPPQMTWSGANPDILAGLAALILAPLATRHRAFAWIALSLCGALLLNVIRVVVVSMPVPFQQYEEVVPLAFGVPTVWIASVDVMGALVGHLLLLRRLLGR